MSLNRTGQGYLNEPRGNPMEGANNNGERVGVNGAGL